MVGDRFVGKTSLYERLVTESELTSRFDKDRIRIEIGGKMVGIEVEENSPPAPSFNPYQQKEEEKKKREREEKKAKGEEEEEEYQYNISCYLSYNVILICFSIVDRESFNNARDIHLKEILAKYQPKLHLITIYQFNMYVNTKRETPTTTAPTIPTPPSSLLLLLFLSNFLFCCSLK